MGQPRPRFARMGKFTRVYEPKEATEYKKLVAQAAIDAGYRLESSAPFVVDIFSFSELAKTHHRKAPVPQQRNTSKPDVDNIAKIVLDALTGVVWVDDSQVTDLSVHKYTAAQGVEPYVRVVLMPVV